MALTPPVASRARFLALVPIVAAFAAVYVIWGSTYLAIAFAIETLPPFLMSGARWIVAGIVLYAWARWRGAPAPSLVNWRAGAIVGALLIVGGNGGVVWAEHHISSGLAALVVASMPLWMVLLQWWRPGGERPTWGIAGGVVMGLAGVALLIAPKGFGSGEPTELLGALAVVGASLSWAVGSLYSRSAPLPSSTLLGAALEMLAGGVMLSLVGLASGEAARVDLAGASTRSVLSFLFLAVFGSIVAFSAYVWLLKATTPARASTYAFVNPVVAVFLGWALAGEPVTAMMLLAGALIVTAVAVIVTRGPAVKPGRPQSPGRAAPSEAPEGA